MASSSENKFGLYVDVVLWRCSLMFDNTNGSLVLRVSFGIATISVWDLLVSFKRLFSCCWFHYNSFSYNCWCRASSAFLLFSHSNWYSFFSSGECTSVLEIGHYRLDVLLPLTDLLLCFWTPCGLCSKVNSSKFEICLRDLFSNFIVFELCLWWCSFFFKLDSPR